MPRRIIFPAVGQTALEAFEPGPPGPDEVRVRTAYSLMSTGTELTILHRRYADDSHFARIFSFPQLKTGVQAVGHVEAVGADVEGLAAGDAVFLRMAHGSHQRWPADGCIAIPAGVALEDACWSGLAKTAFRAAAALEPLAGRRILVVGAGPVGQMLVRWLLDGGADVIVTDVAARRLAHAESAGRIRLLPGGLGADLGAATALLEGELGAAVVDTTGNAAVFEKALAVAPEFGRLILLGDTGYPAEQRLSSAMMSKGLTVQAVHDSHDRDGWNERRIVERFLDLALRGRFALDGLITHRFAPEEHADAYALADARRHDTLGILFDWRGG